MAFNGRHKFEKSIRDNVLTPHMDGGVRDGYGIIMGYDILKNTATVMTSQGRTDVPGDMHYSVPCPVQMGVQAVAPETGRQCWVVFKGDGGTDPTITHFYNYFYNEVDHKVQSTARAALPRFIYNL